MYWVVALFDEQTEQKITDIWQALSDHKISFYGEEIKDGRPHLTIASYDELDEKEYLVELEKFYSGRAGFTVTFNTVGSFLNYQTLFLSPTVTAELMEFHKQYHEHFKKYNSTANAYYLPDHWIPHCTLANKISDEKLAQAFQFCLERQETLKGQVTEIALIKLAEEKDGVIDAPIIYSRRLDM